MIRDRIEAVIAAWPATNGDPPDTDYQRGYLAACEEHARELAKILAEEEGRPEPAADALVAALRDMLAGWRYIRMHHGDLYGVGWDRCQKAAEAALAAAQEAGR